MSEVINEQAEPVEESSSEAVIHVPDAADKLAGGVPSAANEVFTITPQMMNYAITAIIFLLLGIVIGGLMFSDDALTELQLRTILNETLSQVNLDDYDYLVDDDPYLGPEDAPVTIVEFSDYLCPYCERHYQDTFHRILADYDGLVRYVYRDFRGVGGDYGVYSAMAADCANDQGRFWDFHDMLFDNQQALPTPDIENVLIGFATDLELDVPTFSSCLTNHTYLDEVMADTRDAESERITGTPGFFVNGRFINGAQDYAVFVAIIEDELAKAGIVRETAS